MWVLLFESRVHRVEWVNLSFLNCTFDTEDCGLRVYISVNGSFAVSALSRLVIGNMNSAKDHLLLPLNKKTTAWEQP